MNRTDPACATCREKCRRCDRTRPTCRRCAAKGLECKGYPERFRFRSVTSPGKKSGQRRKSTISNHVIQFEEESPQEANSLEATNEGSRKGTSPQLDLHESAYWDIDITLDSSSANSSPVSRHLTNTSELNDLLAMTRTQSLLTHYDKVICPHQIMLSETDTNNPYRSYVLPLAYEQLGVLYAVLGLSACHRALTVGENDLREVADEYRLRLDVIRSFSDPKRLCVSSDLRRKIVALSTSKFEQVNGCPRELFLEVGDALEYAKARQVQNMDFSEYKELLMGVYLSINLWKLPNSNLPDDGSNWGAVYESFRHAFLLYTSRLLSPEQPAELPIIRESVEAVLDAVSEIPSSLIDLAIFPLFIAGTDTLSLHSRHYIILRLDAIRSVAGFSNDLPKMLLRQVWEARGNQPKWDSRNILWTSFVNIIFPGPEF
ncbi:hypothetical protein N7533_007506 [Penicillium manginii]|uniref:uncharacterized protein n=1 Tax=Penicillium manginii TaxID=203109 RepID=UPI002547523D|nr:uncharacterized protein N7533_007506 [Penicillium manginii]KAJ5750478.1 hypothetical protein N7533_007506 [Penicillium manginii]